MTFPRATFSGRPEVKVQAMLRALLGLLDRLRGLFLPFGLFAVVAVGIHAGSDRVDDLSFLLYDRLDGLVDRVVVGLLGWGGGALGLSPERVDTWGYGFVQLLDLDEKAILARWTALFVELGADLILALPVFLGRREEHSFARLWLHLRRDPTILRIVAPLSAALAASSGLFVIARETQAAAFGALDRGLSAGVASAGARVVAATALVLVTARLALPVVLAAGRWADLQAEQDVLENKSTLVRRRRGWLTALVALPVAALAAFEATPFLGTLRAIFWG